MTKTNEAETEDENISESVTMRDDSREMAMSVEPLSM